MAVYSWLSLFLLALTCCTNANEIRIGCHGNRCNLTQKVLSNIGDGTSVVLVSNVIVLTEHIHITNHQNINFTAETEAKINCSHSSGLSFINITNVTISSLSLSNCGALHNSTTTNDTSPAHPKSLTTALYLENCTNMILWDLNITQSNGIGLTIYNCIGEVSITGSRFMHSSVKDGRRASGGNGMYIEFSYCSPDWYSRCGNIATTSNGNSTYRITGCVFEHNTVSRAHLNGTQNINNSFHGLGKGGGGMSIIFKGLARNNVINIVQTTIQYNSAKGSSQYSSSSSGDNTAYGGGLFVQFQDYVFNNTVNISSSKFSSNTAQNSGGGAMDIGYEYNSKSPTGPMRNNVVLYNVTMTTNRALFGGGVSFFSSGSSIEDLKNTLTFINCTWHNNTAYFGSAMLLGPQYSRTRGIFPIPVVQDCIFDGNRVNINASINADFANSSIKEFMIGSGALFLTSFTLVFNGNTRFTNNNGTALYNSNGIIRVSKNSTLTFTNNTGINGGALTLIGPAHIQVKNHSVLTFVNNSASLHGGAIYVFSTDAVSSRTFGSCFIQFINSPRLEKVNTRFRFEDNHADNHGDDIYLTSLLPCARFCSHNIISQIPPEKILGTCVGNFTFSNNSCTIATESRTFSYENHTKPIPIIPGKTNNLPVHITDELGNARTTFLKVRLEDKNDDIDLIHEYVAGPNIEVMGNTGATATLVMEGIGFLNISLALKIQVFPCPPGFFNNNRSCVCALDHKHQYDGIYGCLNRDLRGVAKIGFWIGYYPEDSESAQLVTGTCPLGFCTQSDNGTILLPLSYAPEELEKLMCDKQHRQGILCGECQKGHSVFYHSRRYTCGSNKYCHLGVLFYLLSEILPVTLIFTLTILLRINFTSGYLTGFILFAQILDTLSIEANGGVVLNGSMETLAALTQIVYSPFNLDLFRVEKLSFCFAQGFNFLEVSAIRFLTLTYCLILVLILVIILRVDLCYKVQLLCFKTRLTNSSSLINGLSAFLILCYSFCVRTCYQIYNMGFLYGANASIKYTGVFRNGNVKYFSNQYIPYFMLTTFFMIVMGLIPPLILLLQPLSYRFLPEKVLNWPKLVWFHKIITPFTDAFQSCFKDEHRYFAGLYLIYRSVANGSFAIFNARLEVYTLTEVIFIAMLAVHAWVQPYKNPLHNHIDTGIFATMLVINTLSLYRYFVIQCQVNQAYLAFATYFQLLMVYLPIISLTLGLAHYGYKKFRNRVQPRNADELPELLLSRSISINSPHYDACDRKDL